LFSPILYIPHFPLVFYVKTMSKQFYDLKRSDLKQIIQGETMNNGNRDCWANDIFKVA
jgi:hypothetical protein